MWAFQRLPASRPGPLLYFKSPLQTRGFIVGRVKDNHQLVWLTLSPASVNSSASFQHCKIRKDSASGLSPDRQFAAGMRTQLGPAGSTYGLQLQRPDTVEMGERPWIAEYEALRLLHRVGKRRMKRTNCFNLHRAHSSIKVEWSLVRYLCRTSVPAKPSLLGRSQRKEFAPRYSKKRHSYHSLDLIWTSFIH